MWSKLLFIVLLLSIQNGWAEQDPNCTFSTDGIHKPTFKSSNIAFSKWIGDTAYYAVLPGGKYVYAQYWACNHFGFRADYYIPIEKFKDKDLKKEILFLAKNIMETIDYKEFENKVMGLNHIIDKSFELQHKRFSNLTLSTKEINFSVMISILAYM